MYSAPILFKGVQYMLEYFNMCLSQSLRLYGFDLSLRKTYKENLLSHF